MIQVKLLMIAGVIGFGWLGLQSSQAALSPDPAVLEAQQQRVSMAAKASRSAVAIFDSSGGGGGSGVIIDPDGYTLTNFHVVQPCGPHMKCGLNDGQLYDAVIVGVDPVGDVALIKLLGREDFPAAELADSDEVAVGQWCFTVGNPFLLATDFQPSVAWGLVSGVRRYQYPAGTLLEYTDCIQTDAAINPGNSGGPLFDASARVIGINGRASFEKRGRVNVGVGYAISINQIKRFLGYLHSGRILDHATLGATVTTDFEGRVVVSNILPNSDAHRRGLRFNDEIVFLGDRVIETVNGFKNALGVFPRGWRVPVSYRRDGERHNVNVRLTGVHNRVELIDMVQGQSRPNLEPDQETPDAEKNSPEDISPEEFNPEEFNPEDGDEGAPGEEAPGDQRENPLRPRKPAAGEQANLPAHVAKLYKARSGYANYYFNELNRDRVWNQFQQLGDFTSLGGDWVMSGSTKQGQSLGIVLDRSRAYLRLDDEPLERLLSQYSVTVEEQFSLRNPGAPQHVIALGLWRQLLTLSPARFGEVYYLGRVPGYRDGEMREVLVATTGAAECYFQFSPESGMLMAMEVFSSANEDPLVLLFRDYDPTEFGHLPSTVHFLRGDGLEASYLIDDWKLEESNASGHSSGAGLGPKPTE